MSQAIATGIVVVPDDALTSRRLAGADERLRFALPAIEQGLGSNVEWSFYRDANAVDELAIARAVYGVSRLKRRRRRAGRAQNPEEREESSASAQSSR